MIDYNTFQDRKAVYVTLGCKLNFAETSALGKQLAEMGIRKARENEIADICILNTCSVTDLSDKKCRQTIRRLIKTHPGAYIVVTGCYAQLKPEEIAEIEGVDLVIGSNQKMDIASHIVNFEKKSNEKCKIVITKTKDIAKFVPSVSHDDRTRYFLKVQDGCDYYCTYCTIPLARGKSRNGSIESIIAQVSDVVAEGGKEIVLTGVNTGDFGKTTGETFFQLIKALDEIEGIDRYRISSIEPNLLTDEIIEFVSKSKRFAPHFHLPLQSGSDSVLKLMKRKYDTALFKQKIKTIKEQIPDAFIGVDVIVGTRGEKEEYFEEAFDFIKDLEFSQLHVFSYSERPGTKALNIEYEVSPQDKQYRSKVLLDLSDTKKKAFYQNEKGNIRKVLFEFTEHDNEMYGFTENYVRVVAPYDNHRVNRLSLVLINDYNEEKGAMTCSFM